MSYIKIRYVRTDNEGTATETQIFRVFMSDTLVHPQGSRAVLDLAVVTAGASAGEAVPIMAGKVGEKNLMDFHPTKGQVTLDPMATHPVSTHDLFTYVGAVDRLVGIMGRVYNPSGPVWSPDKGEHTPDLTADWDAFLSDVEKDSTD